MKGWVISWTQDWSHQQAIKRVIEIEQSSNRAIVWSSERAIERVIERSNSRASDRVTEGQRSPKRSIDRSIDRASERSGWLPLSGCRALRFTCNKQFVQMGASVLGHKHQIIEHPNLVCWLTQYCIVRSTNRSSTIKIKKSQILRCKNKIPSSSYVLAWGTNDLVILITVNGRKSRLVPISLFWSRWTAEILIDDDLAVFIAVDGRKF